MKRLTLQQMIDERHRIADELRQAMSEADMDMKAFAALNDKYHWLDDKIRKKGKKQNEM